MGAACLSAPSDDADPGVVASKDYEFWNDEAGVRSCAPVPQSNSGTEGIPLWKDARLFRNLYKRLDREKRSGDLRRGFR
jgi:hypothetical protein